MVLRGSMQVIIIVLTTGFIFRFIFEGELNIDSGTVEVETVWNDAAILGIKDLMEACVNYMIDNVGMCNWWKWLRFSGKENFEPLKTAIMNFIGEKYLDCLGDENFTKLKSAEVTPFHRIV